MERKNLTQEDAQILHILNKLKMPWKEVRERFYPDVPLSSLRRMCSEYRKRIRDDIEGNLEDPDNIKRRVQFTQSENEGVVWGIDTVIMTLEELLAAANVDLDVWYVKEWTPNAWGQHSVRKGYKTIYQVKAKLIRKVPLLVEDAVKSLIDRLQHFIPVYPPLAPPKPNGDAFLAELSVLDLHDGKYAWAAETGQHYDMDEATRLYHWALDELMADAIRYPLERIMLVIGNDMFTADNSFGTTTRGTPQDVHGRHLQHFTHIQKMVQESVDKLQPIAPVSVMCVSGNHDRETMYFLGEVLKAWYHKNQRVTVHNSPALHQYVKYGNSTIGFTHGDGVKIPDLPTVMANEVPELWGSTIYHEWHIGHFHRKKTVRFMPLNERQGTRVRVLPSLCAADAWHYWKGFAGGVRAAEGYMWHRQHGMKATFSANANSTLSEPEELAVHPNTVVY